MLVAAFPHPSYNTSLFHITDDTPLTRYIALLYWVLPPSPPLHLRYSPRPSVAPPIPLMILMPTGAVTMLSRPKPKKRKKAPQSDYDFDPPTYYT